MTKLTKIAKMEIMAKALADNEIVIDEFDVDEFIAHEKELAAKKNANRKPTKVQVENEKLRETLLTVLTETPQTIAELKEKNEGLKELNTQKITPQLKVLIEEGKAIKEYDKKVAKFRLA